MARSVLICIRARVAPASRPAVTWASGPRGDAFGADAANPSRQELASSMCVAADRIRTLPSGKRNSQFARSLIMSFALQSLDSLMASKS
jgi:hypothetical protein